MAENTLDVRLLHAAKTLADWNNVTTIPKLGEVCLEIQGNTPPLNYKIKIGDGSSTYAALPYFGTVVNTSGNASVVVVDTITDGSVTKKVLKFYKLTLTTSTVNGVTTITPTIGDLVLTVQEGDGINFSTNTTDTLVNVELEATTADTAQTIADGGTFTTITKDSNNRATKYTTFTLPSIANSINALDVADNTVITAEWDNINKQIKFYYVKETDGIIQKGSLAYTINATDIAPLQNITTTDAGNSGLEITTNNNAKDVHHKAVTQNIVDNSSTIEEKELDIITNIGVDSYGHITGYTKDKSTNLVAADIKAPVRQSDNSMWNHRVTGGTINIGEETAKISKLRGNTLVWNQIYQPIQSVIIATYLECTLQSDNRMRFHCENATFPGGGRISALHSNTIKVLKNHVYLVQYPWLPCTQSYFFTNASDTSVYIGIYNTNGVSKVQWPYDDTNITFGMNVIADGPYTFDIYEYLYIIDLTKMFGAGNEPATVEEFEAMFPNSYYPYNEGELLSLNPDGVKSVGFNLWDEEWELGYWNSTGWHDNDNFLGSKNYIAVLPSTPYFFKSPTNVREVQFWDANKNYIGRVTWSEGDANSAFNTPAKCHYLTFYFGGSYGTTYKNDICINLSDSSRNDTYEPYKESILDLSWIKSIKDTGGNQLFPYGLLSAGSVHDEVGDNYAVKRVGSVDLGSLSWMKINGSTQDYDFFVSNFYYDLKLKEGGLIKSVQYTNGGVGYSSGGNYQCYMTGDKRIRLRNLSYSDATAFKTAMQGVMLYYEFNEPVTVYFDKKPMTYPVDDLGTETLLPEGVDSTTGVPLSAPFNGTFEYKSNFKDTVLDLIDRVNNARNPVKGVTNTNQTVDKLAIYDSVETVKSSNYSPSNATIVEGATGNDVILPSVETIVNYVNSKLSSALNYKGTISQWSDLPTSGQSTGDMYIAAATFTEGSVTYQAGDFFIWNGTDWDIVSGTTSVVNSNPTLTLDGRTYPVGTVDGRVLQVTTPNLDYSSSSSASSDGQSIVFIDNVSQTDGLISATKKSIPNASTTQAGVTSFVSDIHYSTDNEKTATAKQIWTECEKRNVQFVEAGVVPTGLPMTEDEFINTYAYGVKWVQGGSECTRVGNSSLHETMPIHNALRACVYQIVPQEVTVTETINGIDYTLNYGAKREFRYWLDDDDWNKKADGTPSVLTGEDMTGIAIWHPKFYGKSFDGVVDGSTSYNSVYVSLVQYDNTWTEIKEGYVDFAKMQTVSSNGVNYARSFGNPDFSVDNPSTTEMTLSAINTWIQTQKDSTQALTKSQVNLNRLTANQYAMNAGAHLMSLDEYKWIFCWLPVIECAAFTVEENTHFDWQDGSDTNVVMRDSLSNIPNWMYYGMYSANYSAITGTCGWAFVPAGYTNKLGTHTGWVKMRLPNSGNTYDSKIASRWRGFEIQRNIWTNFMGVNPVQTNTSGTVDVYSTKNRALWNNNMPIDITDESTSTHANIMPWTSRNTEEPEYTTLTGWEHKGVQKWNDYGTEFDLGSDGNPTYKTLGSSKPDYHYGYMNNANPRLFIAGGSVDYTSNGGPFCFTSTYPAGSTAGAVGFRCCWNIDEYTSVLN